MELNGFEPTNFFKDKDSVTQREAKWGNIFEGKKLLRPRPGWKHNRSVPGERGSDRLSHTLFDASLV